MDTFAVLLYHGFATSRIRNGAEQKSVVGVRAKVLVCTLKDGVSGDGHHWHVMVSRPPVGISAASTSLAV